VFAFFAAGVTIGGFSGLVESLSDPVAVGIVVGLVAGKTIGISGATWLVSRFTRAQLDESLGWPDVIGLAMLAGIGFTVSLLIGALAYGEGSGRDEHGKVGVLVGTVTAAVLASVLLRLRDRRYRLVAEEESRDADADGVPDVYQRPSAES
jgi:NhaA family Na+:H+ antiporter